MYIRVQQVYVRSTDANRCLMSAQALLAGLYPPNGRQVIWLDSYAVPLGLNSQEWSNTISWQPIPVHAKMPIEDDLVSAFSTLKH